MLEQATTIRWTPVWATPAVWLSQQPAQPPSSPGTPNQLDKSLTTYADDVARAVQTNPAFQMYIAMLFSSQQLTQALAPDFQQNEEKQEVLPFFGGSKVLTHLRKAFTTPRIVPGKVLHNTRYLGPYLAYNGKFHDERSRGVQAAKKNIFRGNFGPSAGCSGSHRLFSAAWYAGQHTVGSLRLWWNQLIRLCLTKYWLNWGAKFSKVKRRKKVIRTRQQLRSKCSDCYGLCPVLQVLP